MENIDEYVEMTGISNEHVINGYGNIIKITNGKSLVPCDDGKGFKKIVITIKGTNTEYKVHRLVALFFVPNPLNRTRVVHIDGDKNNNHYQNLKWCTNRECRNYHKPAPVYV